MFYAFIFAACLTFLSPVSVGPWTCPVVHLDCCAVLHVSCSSNSRICFSCCTVSTSWALCILSLALFIYFRWSVRATLLLSPVSPPCPPCSWRLNCIFCRNVLFCLQECPGCAFVLNLRQTHWHLLKCCHDSFLATLAGFLTSLPLHYCHVLIFT